MFLARNFSNPSSFASFAAKRRLLLLSAESSLKKYPAPGWVFQIAI